MKKDKLDIKKCVILGKKNLKKYVTKRIVMKKVNIKAPKSRKRLNDYYFFCINHIKEYNKSWDFYKGLTVDQIENSMREDTIWNRPSWPLKGAPNKVFEQIKSFFDVEYDELNSKDNFFFNKEIKEVVIKG